MKTDFSTLIFSDWYGWVNGCHDMDTLGESDVWERDWVFYGNNWSTQLHRQKLSWGNVWDYKENLFWILVCNQEVLSI